MMMISSICLLCMFTLTESRIQENTDSRSVADFEVSAGVFSVLVSGSLFMLVMNIHSYKKEKQMNSYRRINSGSLFTAINITQ